MSLPRAWVRIPLDAAELDRRSGELLRAHPELGNALITARAVIQAGGARLFIAHPTGLGQSRVTLLFDERPKTVDQFRQYTREALDDIAFVNVGSNLEPSQEGERNGQPVVVTRLRYQNGVPGVVLIGKTSTGVATLYLTGSAPELDAIDASLRLH